MVCVLALAGLVACGGDDGSGDEGTGGSGGDTSGGDGDIDLCSMLEAGEIEDEYGEWWGAVSEGQGSGTKCTWLMGEDPFGATEPPYSTEATVFTVHQLTSASADVIFTDDMEGFTDPVEIEGLGTRAVYEADTMSITVNIADAGNMNLIFQAPAADETRAEPERLERLARLAVGRV